MSLAYLLLGARERIEGHSLLDEQHKGEKNGDKKEAIKKTTGRKKRDAKKKKK